MDVKHAILGQSDDVVVRSGNTSIRLKKSPNQAFFLGVLVTPFERLQDGAHVCARQGCLLLCSIAFSLLVRAVGLESRDDPGDL